MTSARETTAWRVMGRRSKECLDGEGEYLMGIFNFGHDIPPFMAVGYRTAVFRTRAEARKHIEEKFGYMRDRLDLKQAPHGWRMPIPVRIKVSVTVEPAQ